MTLFIEILWIWSLVIGLGCAGMGITLLIIPHLKFKILITPFVGMLLVILITAGLYISARLPFRLALTSSYTICILISAGVFITNKTKRFFLNEIKMFFTVVLVLALTYSWLSNSATIITSSSAISFLDGTDHAGYANVADWIIANRVSESLPALSHPLADPLNPYEQLPNIMINWEPRTGAFIWLAIIASVRNIPALFSYDPACAVFLVIAISGVAAVFTESWLFLILLMAGLFTSQWFEFSHTGYLGKMLCYPTIFLIAGLMIKRDKKSYVFPLILLSAASGLLLNGIVAAGLLGLIGGINICAEFYQKRYINWNHCNLLLLLLFAAITTDGLLAHPWNRGFPNNILSPIDLASRALDISSWAIGYRPINLVACILTAMMLIGPIVLLFLLKFEGPAVGFLLSPIVLLIILLPKQSPGLLQLTAFLYPCLLCGTVLALQEHQRFKKIGILLFLLMITLTIPRMESAVLRYATKSHPGMYTLQESNDIAVQVENETVSVDVGGDPWSAIFLMVELGRRNISMQWSEKDWQNIAYGWRKWPLPKYLDLATVKIIRSEQPSQTAHFKIIKVRQNLTKLSLETVQMFARDAKDSGFLL